MRVEFIALGSEILIKNIPETNSLAVQEMLLESGHELHAKTVLKDEPEEIRNYLSRFKHGSAILLITGGLGPTVDDITVEVVAEFLGRELVFDEQTWEKIERRYKERNRQTNEGDKKQAYVIDGAEVLLNVVGQAPGQYIQNDNLHIFLFPGVPREFIAMLDKQARPIIDKILGTDFRRKRLTFKLCAIPESVMNDILKKNLGDLLPLEGEELIMTTSPGIQTIFLKTDSDSAEKRVTEIDKAFKREFPEAYYAHENIGIEEKIADLLIKKKLRVATAESCTGGSLASKLTDIPGSSGYFYQGLVTYSNESKQELLDVQEETIIKYGAVSEETATAMAENLFKKLPVDITISVTGIAGPTGGTEDKPVGTVFIGICDKFGTSVKRFSLMGERSFFKQWVSSIALNLLRLRVEELH